MQHRKQATFKSHLIDVWLTITGSTVSSMITPTKRRVFTPPRFRYKGSNPERPTRDQQNHHESLSSSSDVLRQHTRGTSVDKPNTYTHDKSPISTFTVLSDSSPDAIPSRAKDNASMLNGPASKLYSADTILSRERSSLSAFEDVGFHASKRYRIANGHTLPAETQKSELFTSRPTSVSEEVYQVPILLLHLLTTVSQIYDNDHPLRKTLSDIKKYGLPEIPSYDSLKRSPVQLVIRKINIRQCENLLRNQLLAKKQHSFSERRSPSNGDIVSSTRTGHLHMHSSEVPQKQAEDYNVRRLEISQDRKDDQEQQVQQQSLVEYDLNRQTNRVVSPVHKPSVENMRDEDVFKQPAAVGSTLHAQRQQLQQSIKNKEAWAEKENLRSRPKEDTTRNSEPVIPGKEILTVNPGITRHSYYHQV